MKTSTAKPDLNLGRPSVILAAAILTDANGTLLVRRSDPEGPYTGLWDRPLFQVGAESPEDKLVSGLREEFGIEVESFSLDTVQDDVHEDVFYRRFVFRVGSYVGQVKTDNSMRWYTDAEIRDVFQLNPLVSRGR